ncbi:MAG: hypothetical protein SGBAC_011018 [Bacillariaceae sp.]
MRESTPDGYKHKEALFGRPPYGGSIQANVYYIDSQLCDANADYSRGGYPSRDIDETGQMARWKPPFMLMMNRGNCTFVEKVRNAQHAGASAALIADTTCLCSHGDTCQSDDAMAQCESKEPIMADDRSGTDVIIPSFLMFKQDADPIKNSIKINNTVVSMKMTWALPRPDSRVEYSLWTTPKNIVSRPLLQNFGEVAKALGNHATFVPHMYIVDGTFAGCSDSEGFNVCSALCTNQGKYCASAPDLRSGISGSSIVKESLRRLCIWEEYGKQDGIGMPWWNYVSSFIDRCDDEKYFIDDACVKDAMNDAGVDYDTVEECMANSGGLEEGDNIMLEKELTDRDETGVVIVPSFFVNDTPLRGALSSIEVFEAICAGFAPGSEPPVCTNCNNCGDLKNCVKAGHCHGAKGSMDTVSTPVFGSTILLLVVIFSTLGYIQWRRSQNQMNDQVRQIMAQYMPIDKNQNVESLGIPQDDYDEAEDLPDFS